MQEKRAPGETPGEEELLRSVALQTASSIRWARQRAEEALALASKTLEAKTAELERALLERQTEIEVTQVLVNASAIDEVIGDILEILCRNLSWTCAQLWRADRGTGVMRRVAGWCDSACCTSDFEALASFSVMAAGAGLPGRIWASKQPAWIEDVQSDRQFVRAGLASRMGLRAGFGFPLTVAGAVAGVIELFHTEPRPIDQATLKLAATLGSHIGQFIQREAAEADQRNAFRQLRRLHEVTETALANLPLQPLFENLLSKICDAVDADIAVVLMLDAAAHELYAAATFGPNTESLLALRLRIGESLAGRVAAERKVIVVPDAQNDVWIRPAFRALGVRTVVGIPLLARDELTGVLEVGSFTGREFAVDDIEFIQHVGHQFAIAIENSLLYEEAREANRLKDRFLSIASHELRTPLNALLGWTEVLRTIDNAELRVRALDAIEASARTQAELIEDMLDASRAREGKLVLDLTPVDLNSVVTAAVKAVQFSAQQRGVRLETELPAHAVVQADGARIRQVMWNLLSNAIKFTPAGKRIRTQVRANDDVATITVEDEGEGISPEFLPHMFDELRQAQRGRGGGLGLGLYIVKTIVSLHGGTVEARSEGIGRGAAFTVRLPVGL
jgi:signal transduction histidine kinase